MSEGNNEIFGKDVKVIYREQYGKNYILEYKNMLITIKYSQNDGNGYQWDIDVIPIKGKK